MRTGRRGNTPRGVAKFRLTFLALRLWDPPRGTSRTQPLWLELPSSPRSAAPYPRQLPLGRERPVKPVSYLGVQTVDVDLSQIR